MRASKGKGREEPDRVRKPRVSFRPKAAAVAAAAPFVVVCLVPIVLWGNPYPPKILTYWLGGSALAAIIAALVANLPSFSIDRLIALSKRATSSLSPGRFAALVGAATAAIAFAMSSVVFQHAASTSDELAQLWHAQVLLTGHLFLPVDPNREFFALETVVDSGKWYSQFPIGGPAVLTLGALVGKPWLVNPILAAGACMLLYHFGRRAFGEAHGRAIAALFALSPMIVMMSGTWMNHVPTLFLATAALAALVEWERATTRVRAHLFAALVGLAVGLMLTIRPVDAAVAAVAIAVFQLAEAARTPRRLVELPSTIAGGAVGLAVLFYANAATTGDIARFGYDVLWGPGQRLGFHIDPYGRLHTISHGLEHAVTYVSELNLHLTAWPVPAMLVVVAGVVLLPRVTKWDVLLLALFWLQVAAYAAYWGEGEFLGPRFLFTALPAVIVFAARAPVLLAVRASPRGAVGLATFAVACAALSWCVPGLSYNALGLGRQASTVRGSFKADIRRAVREANLSNAVVVLREPFGQRVLRRLWGLGFLRSQAAQLLSSRDGCSLLDAIRAAEADSAADAVPKLEALIRRARPYEQTAQSLQSVDGTVRISSSADMPADCKAEIEYDAKVGGAAFGPALPLEPIDASGHVDGDVIYIADLTDRNRVMEQRFRGRSWYRLRLVRGPSGSMRAQLASYP